MKTHNWTDSMLKTENTVGETPRYEVSDLLVSRTDDRGVILAANEVFERISGYDWEQLHNAPHKLVRHPDMPKGVFWLIWETIGQKKPFGGFVKNRAKNGTYYWVFAFMAPQGDGYLSVRIKPTTHAVEFISKEYAALLKLEKEEGLSPAQSGARLLERISELGYHNYEHFSASFAAQVFAARDKDMRRRSPDRVEKLVEITSDWAKIRAQSEQIKEAHHQISNTPTNLRVQAAHLNERGIALSVIASNFTTLASEIESSMKIFLRQAAEVEDQLNRSSFSVCLESLMHEVVGVFQEETAEIVGIDWDAEVALLEVQRQSIKEKTSQELTAARQEIASFSNLLDETARIMSGLSVAKVMCEIENAYVGVDSSLGVTGIIGELDRFQTVARKSLFEIRLNLTQISQSIKGVQSSIKKVPAAA